MKKISIVTPCYNEEGNIREIYTQIKHQFELLKDRYVYEHIFIDNASTDNTVKELREVAAADSNVKVILNAMNFGHIRSPFYGLCQAGGDAVMLVVADLQDPPETIPQFLEQWEQGHRVVVGVKNKSRENHLMYFVRRLFYRMIQAMSEVRQIENFTGFGLYDHTFVEFLRKVDDPYPYMRGLVSEYGGDVGVVYYTQPKRFQGKTHNNLYTLYDMAMLGFTSHTKVPFRLAAFTGVAVSVTSIGGAVLLTVLSLCSVINTGVGSVLCFSALFFVGGLILLFLGIVGEYVGAVLTQVKRRPLVVEKERINF